MAFYKFTDLKNHYKTETMLEVILDPVKRRDLTNRALYKNGNVINMEFNKHDGLIAYDYNVLGIGIIIKVTEPYLEQLMISHIDFYAITGGNGQYRYDFVLDELIDNSKKKYKSNIDNANTLKGVCVIASTVIAVMACKLLFGNVPEPVQTKSRK